MKLKSLSLLAVLCVLALNMANAQTKRALIFAIGNYPDSSGWPQISSVKDVALIKSALTSQQFADIKVVEDGAATVKGILSSIDDLIARSNPGDVVVIHFSSHGEQIEDENHKKVNGLEECIVGFNAIMADEPPTPEKFEQLKKGYLREDVFGAYLKKLRAKLGKSGDVAVFMDLCHASVGTRGSEKIRGGKAALVSTGFKKNQATTGGGKDFDIDGDVKADESTMSPYVVIGAARAEEFDQETRDDNRQGIGSLSYAISKVFATTGTLKTMSYRSLFARVQAIMNIKVPAQNPVLSGNGIDRGIFGGQFVPQKRYVEISKVTGPKITLKEGSFSGLDVGARVAVYPIGTSDTAHIKPIASGAVVSGDAYSSIVNIDKVFGAQPALGCYVFITGPVYKFDPLSIQIVSNVYRGRPATTSFSPAESLKMERALKELNLVKIDDVNPNLQIIKGPVYDSVIIASTGALLDTIKNSASDTALLKQTVKNYMQYCFLKKIDIKDASISLDIKLVPVIHGKADTSNVHLPKIDYAFAEGDTIMIWVHNSGPKGLYFNILDMQPNGVINPVLPITSTGPNIPTVNPEELFVKPGISTVYPYPIVISPPYGKEIFKVFLSEKIIDMQVIATTRGATSRGSFSPLEGLVKTSYSIGASRGAGIKAPVGKSTGSAYNLAFDIKEKKK